ncbi:hypothetical protein Pelo_12991 [Pelomyxa schiedti]|nr:hypothetical protein Pelo_12991 [Pelomyxa schiedti]
MPAHSIPFVVRDIYAPLTSHNRGGNTRGRLRLCPGLAYDLDTQSFTYTDAWTTAIALYKYPASLGSINSTDKFTLQTLVPLLAERDMPPTVVAYSLLLGSTLSLPPLPLGASWGLYYSVAPNMTMGWNVYLMPRTTVMSILFQTISEPLAILLSTVSMLSLHSGR